MKTGSFNDVDFTMERAHGYGQYTISANYGGEEIRVHSTNSKAWDWLDDDSDEEMHNEAQEYCYRAIMDAYRG